MSEKEMTMGRELYVGKISFKATENDIRRLFSVAGAVSSIHLITDPQTGQFKGCCYVKMATAEEAKEAIDSLDGALLIDRVITVSEARPQKQTAHPSGGGRRKPGQDTRSRLGRK